MNREYDALFLSPQLDDVALSCGGQIAQETAGGRSILIVTLMAGESPAGSISAFARGQHARWRFERDAAARRRAEDAAACAILGAEFRHGPFLDCIYRGPGRGGRSYYNSDDEIFGAVHPQDQAVGDLLVDYCRTLPAAGRVIAPLTAGNHVDHQLTRAAAEAVWGERLIYYEDYPYAGEPGVVARLASPAAGWRPLVLPLTGEAIRRKIAAIAAYASQIETLFQSPARMAEQVSAFADRAGGERLWFRNGWEPTTLTG